MYITSMPLTFHTNSLNKRLYHRMVENVLLNLGVSVFKFKREWDIHLWPLCATNTQFFEHITTTSGQKINPNMPSGVTGKYRIDLYLHDSDNDFKSRENSDRVQHEMCHAILYGTPHFVKGVHDNIGDRFTVIFWYWGGLFWKKFQLSVINIKRFI